MPGESVDITKENIEKLKALFPEVVSEGKVDFEKLKNIFTRVDPDDIASDERYNFTWSGKRRNIHVAQQPSKGTLRPVKEKSKNWNTTENLYIEGDNLEVLKLLQKSYFQRIKMIYIDPPYNTGNDFVYKDNFKDELENYLEQTGQVDSDGNKLSTNTESNGRYHSDWLNMIYPRLKVARNLLMDKGIIMISIDDHEIDNLMKICGEIFGVTNFVGIFVWKRRTSSAMDQTNMSTDHEYVIAYRKVKFSAFRGVKKDFKGYSNPDNDPRGIWTTGDLTVGMNADMRPNQYYEITDPLTGLVYKPNFNRVWSYVPESMKKLISENRVIFPKDPTKKPALKRFASELKSSVNPFSTLMESVGMNTEGTREVNSLFNASLFNYAKPVSLLTTLIKQTARDNDIILDFFSGSATTAQAVIQVNAEEKSGLKFIMVQLPELTENDSQAKKYGYNNLCELGEERIRRAGEKIKSLLIEKRKKEGMLSETMDPNDLDIGFKVFKLDRSNIQEWYADFDHIGEQLNLFENNFVKGRSEEDIVYEIMLKSGLDLNYPIEKINFHGKKIFSIAYGALFICLDDQVTSDIADKLIELKNELKPEKTRVVFKDLGFKDDQTKINVYETLKANGFDELMSI
jgi:Adenine specific DNA methylase Mod